MSSSEIPFYEMWTLLCVGLNHLFMRCVVFLVSRSRTERLLKLVKPTAHYPFLLIYIGTMTLLGTLMHQSFQTGDSEWGREECERLGAFQWRDGLMERAFWGRLGRGSCWASGNVEGGLGLIVATAVVVPISSCGYAPCLGWTYSLRPAWIYTKELLQIQTGPFGTG